MPQDVQTQQCFARGQIQPYLFGRTEESDGVLLVFRRVCDFGTGISVRGGTRERWETIDHRTSHKRVI